MRACELDTAEARLVAASVLELADPRSVEASRAWWLCGLADQVDPHPDRGRNQPMCNPVTGNPIPALATDRIGVVAREAA
jgi:hypothetical protein